MDNFLYINAGKSALSLNISASQTTLVVANPGRFPTSVPAGQVLILTLHPEGLPSTHEIVHCTAINGAVFTVVRGAQGTTPASWPGGTVVGAYITALIMSQIFDEIDGHAGAGGSVHAAATPVAAGFMAAADKAKLDGVQTGATNYQHPANHDPSVIAQNSSNRFVTDPEKANWNAAKNHADSAHAPSDAQKNSDITNAEIQAKLTGALASHSHTNHLAATGGTITGNLTIQGAAPTISFVDTDNADRSLHCNSNIIGFLNSGGGWSFYSQDDGQNVSPNNMIIGGSTHSTDGNVYMPWAGDWLSNVLSRKMGTDPTAEGVGAVALVMGNKGLALGVNGVYAASQLRRLGFKMSQVGHDDPNYTENALEWVDGGNIGQGTWRFLGPSMNYGVWYWAAGIAQRIA